MKKGLRMIFPCVCLGLCIVIACLFVMGISPQTPLAGAVVEAPKPTFSARAAVNGEYETQWQDWFAQQFPLRSYFVKGYDQILYGIGSTVNDVYAGRDGMLLSADRTKNFISGGVDDQILTSFVADMQVIQREMASRGKHFFFLITPCKSEIYSEHLSWQYQAAMAARDEVAQLRKQLVSALQAGGIPYLDFTDLMFELKKNSALQPFCATGAHWNQYGAAQAAVTLTDFMRGQGIPMPQAKAMWMEVENPVFEEQDYQHLLNVYHSQVTSKYYFARLEMPNTEGIQKPRAFAVSTSFSHSLDELYAKERSPFSSLVRSQYSMFQNSVMETADGVQYQSFLPGVPIDQLDFKAIVEENDVVYIETTSDGLPDTHTAFAHQLAAFLSTQ